MKKGRGRITYISSQINHQAIISQKRPRAFAGCKTFTKYLFFPASVEGYIQSQREEEIIFPLPLFPLSSPAVREIVSGIARIPGRRKKMGIYNRVGSDSDWQELVGGP